MEKYHPLSTLLPPKGGTEEEKKYTGTMDAGAAASYSTPDGPHKELFLDRARNPDGPHKEMFLD